MQVPTQFPDAALAFPPPPATFERGKGGKGRCPHPEHWGKQGSEEKVKCNAFSGIPAGWGCSKLPPPAASWNMVQISAQTAQLDIKAASLLVHPSRLTPIPRQCLPLWRRLSLSHSHPTPKIQPPSPPSSWHTKSQQGCARFCRRACYSLSRSFL